MCTRSLAPVALLFIVACDDALDLSAADLGAPDTHSASDTGTDVDAGLEVITTDTSSPKEIEDQVVGPCAHALPWSIEIRTTPLQEVTRTLTLSACGDVPYDVVGAELLGVGTRTG